MLSSKEKGGRLEKYVAEIFENSGYRTWTNVYVKEVSGANAELDVVALKRNLVAVAECKNYESKIGKEKVNAFIQKIKSIDTINVGNKVLKKGDYQFKYYFIASSEFTSDAVKVLEKAKENLLIDYWDMERVIREHEYAILGKREKDIKSVENSLPINVDYEEATRLDLVNKSDVTVESSQLMFIPYYVYTYDISISKSLPNGDIARINEKGKVIVDAKNGEILKRKGLFSKSKTSIIFDTIQKYEPLKKQTLGGYYVIIPPKKDIVLKRTATSIVKKYLKEAYTKTFEYETKSGNYREKTIIPTDKDVIIKKSELIYLPIWKILFKAGLDGTEYNREIVGTGNILTDEISMCQKHLFRSPKSYGVCSKCGIPLCKKHIYKSSDGKYYCWEHLPRKDKEEIKSKSLTSKFKKSGFKIFGKKK